MNGLVLVVLWAAMLVSLATAHDPHTIIVLPKGSGSCTPAEQKHINGLINGALKSGSSLSASGSGSRRLRKQKPSRRLDPLACCEYCRNFAQCYIAQPACSSAPYEYGPGKECPARRRQLHKYHEYERDLSGDMAPSDSQACHNRAQKVETWITNFILQTTPPQISSSCQDTFKGNNGVDLVCVLTLQE